MITGTELRRIRVALGLTLAQVAAEARVSEPAVSLIEKSPGLRPRTADRYFGALSRLAVKARDERDRRRVEELLAEVESVPDLRELTV